MSIEEKLKEMLEKHGLWPEEAEAVIEKAKTSPVLEAMKGRWSDDIEGYPSYLLATTWLPVKDLAIKHLEEGSPEHFALNLLKS